MGRATSGLDPSGLSSSGRFVSGLKSSALGLAPSGLDPSDLAVLAFSDRSSSGFGLSALGASARAAWALEGSDLRSLGLDISAWAASAAFSGRAGAFSGAAFSARLVSWAFCERVSVEVSRPASRASCWARPVACPSVCCNWVFSSWVIRRLCNSRSWAVLESDFAAPSSVRESWDSWRASRVPCRTPLAFWLSCRRRCRFSGVKESCSFSSCRAAASASDSEEGALSRSEARTKSSRRRATFSWSWRSRCLWASA